MNLLVALTLFLTNFAFAELFVKFGVPPKETRRLTHVTAGLLTVLLPYLVNFTEVIILGILFTLFLALTKRQRLLRSIHEIQRKSFGAVLFPVGLLVSALLFWRKNVQLFQISALELSLADGFAGIVGERFGKHKYRVTGQKTIEGSVVFFITTLLIFVAFLGINNAFSPEEYLPIFITSLVLTVVEGSLGGGMDNLIIPVATGLLGTLFLY